MAPVAPMLVASLLLLSSTLPANAAVYFVDPVTGNNANAGTSPTAPWRNPPGTRTTSNGGFVSSNWGPITNSSRLQCGDVVLFRPGRIQDSAAGGAWCVSSTTGSGACNATQTFFNSCSVNNPITFRIATPAEWPGAPSTGNFVLDGTGVTVTSVNTPPGSHDRDAGLISIGNIGGFMLKGLDATRRFEIRDSSIGAWSAGAIAVVDNVTGGVIEWVDLHNSIDALSIGSVNGLRVQNAIIHDNEAHGLDVGMLSSFREVRGLAVIDTEMYRNGLVNQPFDSDAIYSNQCIRCWFIRVNIHDETTNCINGGSSCRSGCTPSQNYRAIFRDVSATRCNLGNANAAGAAIFYAGDGNDTGPMAVGFFQRFVGYGSRASCIWLNHGGGTANVWNATCFATDHTLGVGVVTYDRTQERNGEIHNSIIVPRSYTSQASQWAQSFQTFDFPMYFGNNMFLKGSGRTDSSLVTDWDWRNGFTQVGINYTQAAANSWQVARTTNGNLFETNANPVNPRFVSTGGNCDVRTALTYGDCDFRLQANSDAIDRGQFFLRANGGGTGTTITVKRGDPNGSTFSEYSDPRNFFVEPASYPNAIGDTIQIQNATCGGGGSQAAVTSLTATTITLDRSCTWADNAGVHLPWVGAAPDLGAYEFGSSGTLPPRAPTNLIIVR